MLEIILGDVFKNLYGSSCDPEIPLFVRLQRKWRFDDQGNFKPGSTDIAAASILEGNPNAVDSLDFCVTALESSRSNHSRDDYRELLELSVIFLGAAPPRGVRFYEPEAMMHHARWMVKAIYCLKAWLFRSELPMTPRKERITREISTKGKRSHPSVAILRNWIVLSCQSW